MNKRGFTLIELLAVIAIISLLGIIAVSSFSAIVKSSNSYVNKSNIKLIMQKAMLYSSDNQTEITSSDQIIKLNNEDIKALNFNVKYLKEYYNFNTDEQYDDLQLYFYIKNNRPSSCIDKIINYDILLALFEEEDNISSINEYICQ